MQTLFSHEIGKHSQLNEVLMQSCLQVATLNAKPPEQASIWCSGNKSHNFGSYPLISLCKQHPRVQSVAHLASSNSKNPRQHSRPPHQLINHRTLIMFNKLLITARGWAAAFRFGPIHNVRFDLQSIDGWRTNPSSRRRSDADGAEWFIGTVDEPQQQNHTSSK